MIGNEGRIEGQQTDESALIDGSVRQVVVTKIHPRIRQHLSSFRVSQLSIPNQFKVDVIQLCCLGQSY